MEQKSKKEKGNKKKADKENRVMSGKGFTATVLLGLLGMFLLFGGLVYAVDPYLLYHGPALGLTPVINDSWDDIRNDEMHKNPGMATYLDYDAVILGSSVTENYRASWFSQAFDCNALKLSYSNARTANFDIILDYIFQAKGQNIKKVFLGLDITILNKDPEETSYPLPEEIYDRSLWNQKKYFLNKNVYCETAEALRLNVLNRVPDIDDAYRWEGQYKYSKEEALLHSPRKETTEKMMEAYGSIENCKANLANITQHIQAHPETEFYIIFSPYSILYWDLVVRNGEYEQIMFNTHIAMETLLAYDNVRIFYFQNDEEIITDLDNYMDFIHFSADVNYHMVQAMAAGENQATDKNYLWQMDRMKKIVENYDFDGIY